MREYLDAAADLLLGATCPGCTAPGWGLCRACWAMLSTPPQLIDRAVQVPVVAACQYRPVLAHVIPRYKDDGALHLAAPLGELLARAVRWLGPPSDAVLVPIPSRPAAVRQRGYDHGSRLARHAARHTGLRSRALLRRKSPGQDQQGLGREQRQLNLLGSMRGTGTAAPVVIVDDVATSGASLREALRALEEAGVSVLGAAVIAQAEKLPQHSSKGPHRLGRGGSVAS